MEESDYGNYTRLCKEVSMNEGLFQVFKSISEYIEILEHVTEEQGSTYLSLLISVFHYSEDQIQEYCTINDLLGDPLMYRYTEKIVCSPSSLRYLLHASFILSHFRELYDKTPVSMVEVGCGYGGLFLAIQYLTKYFSVEVQSYSFVDLDECILLQEHYLKNHSVTIPISFHQAKNFGSTVTGTPLFFISNYAFSEISLEYQKKYIENLISRCDHGFITWNAIDLYDFGKQYKSMNEIPLTGEKNKYVFF